MGISCSDSERFVAVTMISSSTFSVWSWACTEPVPAIAVDMAITIALRWLGINADELDMLTIKFPTGGSFEIVGFGAINFLLTTSLIEIQAQSQLQFILLNTQIPYCI